MRTMCLCRLFLASAASTLFSTPAVADPICPVDECAFNWEYSCNDVCLPLTMGGKTIVICDTDDNVGADGDAVAVAVYDDSGGDHGSCHTKPYCAQGVTTSGAPFYCEWGDYGGTLAEVHLRGGSADDKLSFLCEGGGNPAYSEYMREWGGSDLAAPFIGRLSGLDGDDELIGSRRASVDYLDHGEGGPGADDMALHEGDDYADGGGHADRMCMGAGDDAAVGGPGADTMCMQWGDDSASAGLDSDLVLGGSDSDSFNAGAESNTCDNGGGEPQTGCTYGVPVDDCDSSSSPLECPE